MPTFKIFSLLTLLLFCCTKNVHAQTRPIEIGEQCSDLLINNIYNGTYSSAHISDFKGKIVILDFWSRMCSSCLEAMPEMDRLQKQFGDSIVIIPVVSVRYINDTVITEFKKFWSDNKYSRSTSLPFAMDTLLHKKFPMDGVPYEVWIDRNGVVRGLTSGEYVNEKEIRKMYAGIFPNWKNYTMIKFDTGKPLLELGNQVPDEHRPLRYSMFTGYIPRVMELMDFDTAHRTGARIYAVNMPIYNLYKATMRYDFSEEANYFNRIIVEGIDTEKIIYDSHNPSYYYEQWCAANALCLEIIAAPGTTQNRLAGYLRQDLNRWLGWNAHMEKRKIKCVVVSYNTANTLLFRKPSEDIQYYKSIKSVLSDLNYLNKTVPFLDETKIVNDINLPSSAFGKVHSIEDLQSHLKVYGLIFKHEIRELDVFIITP